MSAAPPRVLLWDFDGTLARRPGAWSGTVAEILADHAPELGVTREDVVPHMQGGFPWHTPEVPHPELGDPERWWRSIESTIAGARAAVGVDGNRARELAPLMRSYYLRKPAWALYADTLPALGALAHEGRRQLIVSNHVPELPAIVAYLGLRPYIEAVVNSATCGYEKPHPEIFRHALRLAGDAESVWMVGDSYHADVLGAAAVGLDAVLVRRPHPEAPHYAAGLAEAVALIMRAHGPG